MDRHIDVEVLLRRFPGARRDTEIATTPQLCRSFNRMYQQMSWMCRQKTAGLTDAQLRQTDWLDDANAYADLAEWFLQKSKPFKA